ncbi:hypothetical protein ACFLXO_03045 [Chloroflexota bacterium]
MNTIFWGLMCIALGIACTLFHEKFARSIIEYQKRFGRFTTLVAGIGFVILGTFMILNSYFIGGIFSIVSGIVGIVFHKGFARTSEFQERFNKYVILVAGIGSIIAGTSMILIPSILG